MAAAVTCCMSMCTTVASDCDVTRECVALRMQNLPMPRHVQSLLYFILGAALIPPLQARALFYIIQMSRRDVFLECNLKQVEFEEEIAAR